MTVILWTINIILAVSFVGSGLMKLGSAKDTLVDSGLEWADDYGENTVKLIGGVEFLGALGLILPRALDILPVLSVIAAACVTLVMVGAVTTHVRRGEFPGATGSPALALGVLAAVSTVLGAVTL